MIKQTLKTTATKVLICFMTVFAFSCSDARKAKIGGYGDEFKIQLIKCDGKVAMEWTSTGKVRSEESSDGYYFMDKATGKLVEVTGTLVITKK